MKIIFLRHAETEKDPTVNAADWILSEQGMADACAIAALDSMSEVECIFSSTERKAILTATPLAEKLALSIIPLPGFDEVRRGDTFLSHEAFEAEKERQLLDMEYAAFGGETGTEALERFEKAIAAVSNEYPDKTILIVTHGTVLNMYFAVLQNAHDTIIDRWKDTPFCAYGIVENGKVTKDIV